MKSLVTNKAAWLHIALVVVLSAVQQLYAQESSPSLDIVSFPIGPDIAKQIGLPANHGILIQRVLPGGAAEKAGLIGGNLQVYQGKTPVMLNGDLIVAIDNQEITSSQDLSAALAKHYAGDTLTVTIFRGRHQQDIKVILSGAAASAARGTVVQVPIQAGADVPLTVGLLVGIGGSQRSVLAHEVQASASFLEKTLTRSSDKAFVVRFGRTVELRMNVTDSIPKLEQALNEISTIPLQSSAKDSNNDGGTEAEGGAELYDAVYLSATEVLANEKGQHVLIMLTDGLDLNSKQSVTSAIEAARSSDTTLYAIYYKGKESNSDRRRTLEQMTSETGGRVFEVNAKQNTTSIYATISKELRSPLRDRGPNSPTAATAQGRSSGQTNQRAKSSASPAQQRSVAAHPTPAGPHSWYCVVNISYGGASIAPAKLVTPVFTGPAVSPGEEQSEPIQAAVKAFTSSLQQWAMPQYGIRHNDGTTSYSQYFCQGPMSEPEALQMRQNDLVEHYQQGLVAQTKVLAIDFTPSSNPIATHKAERPAVAGTWKCSADLLSDPPPGYGTSRNFCIELGLSVEKTDLQPAENASDYYVAGVGACEPAIHPNPQMSAATRRNCQGQYKWKPDGSIFLPDERKGSSCDVVRFHTNFNGDGLSGTIDVRLVDTPGAPSVPANLVCSKISDQ